ncbi:MAG: AAA family ATPase [Bacteroides sp.]|nr:AAA family ATPase [Bacteroides sp.]
MNNILDRQDKEAFFKNFNSFGKKQNIQVSEINSPYRPYLTAIKSKPFLLLAGISGTGKSRIVRELARACWEEDSEEYKAQKPKNFEMVQVKPNWHDSSELIGYISRVSGKAEYIPGDFLKFVARAWEDLETPYFLCLDEMNLAPVEQYFAEYLSVIESRKSKEDGTVVTDPILRKEKDEWYFNLTAAITTQENIRTQFNDEGITLPQNLIVVGTVNMDETTFSFSRKVLDRAMTIEMNEVDLYGGLTDHYEPIGKLGKEELIGTAVEGVDVYSDNQDVCNIALDYLKAVNDVLEGTPFKVAYRTRNEFLLYVVNNLPYNKDEEGEDLPLGYVIARALDEITSMKILSRIEGDDTKVNDVMLDTLSKTIAGVLTQIAERETFESSVSLAKIAEMKRRLASGYTSFWS